MTRKINLIVIHCSATASGKKLQQGPGSRNAAQVIDAWHKARGFNRTPAASAAFNSLLRHIGYGDNFGRVGAATPYAAIQQLGGSIDRAPYSTKVRLRTDAKGNLMRQGKDSKLAVFAKDSHKRVRESWAEVGAYTVKIPARPYLPFKGSIATGVLQPETERKVLDLVVGMLGESLN